MNNQTPNSNNQTNLNIQIPITKPTRFRKLVIGYWLLFGVWYLLIGVSSAHAEELKAKEPVVVNGDRVEYFQEKKMVVGSGNISITYKDVVLTCDKVTVYLDTREAIAEGDVKITQEGAYFTGDRMNYNFDTRIGHAINGYISHEPFYGKAQEIDKLSEKQVNLKRGYVTTCDLDKPHYRVQARQVRIYLDDKVIAKHVLFFFKNTPVFYWPYYVQPIKERTAHITAITGKNDEWGYFGLSSLRYDFSQIAKGRFRADYRQLKGLAWGIDNYYETDELGSGAVKFYFMKKEHDRTVIRTPKDEKKPTQTRWRVQARHRWDITEDTTSISEFNSLSDKDFLKDYFYNEFQELQTPENYNYASVITAKPDYTMSLLLRKRYDKFFTVVERFPELKIDIKNYRLGEFSPFYYKAELTGAYLNKTFEGSTEKDLDIIRLDAYNQFTYTRRLFRFWNISPYAGNRQTYFSRNRWGDTNVIRNVFNFGIDNSTKLYRIFDVTSNFLGMEINKLRHIITPTVNYFHTHQPTISPDNLMQFDGLDSTDYSNGIGLSLQNKLQTKWRQEDGNLESVDLAMLLVSSNFNFTSEKANIDFTDFQNEKFQDVSILLELSPYPWLFIQHKSTVDTKRQAVEQASIDIAARQKKKWSANIGYRYEDVKSGRQGNLIGNIYYKLSPKWEFRMYERYNIYGKKRKVEEQEYAIIRDLHCWLLEVTFNIKGSFDKPIDKAIYVVFRLKAFPDTPFGFKRVYSKPAPGSTSSVWRERWATTN